MLQNGMREHDAINPTAAKQASGILQRILDEEPEFWPYGLSMDQFDGGLYLLSKQANSSDYMGFVGWQERDENGRRVGYYAIGVLPEYRRQGLAKAAVQKLLREKAAGVDEIRALVMAHNEPSQQLAHSIPGVKLTIFEKLASIEKSALSPNTINILKNIIAPTTGAILAHTTFDQMADTNRTLGSTFRPDTWGDDKMRKLLAVLNVAGGAGAGFMATRGGQTAAYAAPLFLSLPVKDLAMKGIGSLHKADDLAEATRAAITKPKAAVPNSVLYGALGLGAGALGLGAYASLQKARAARAQAEAARGGRVKVTLPTKDPHDAETLLDIPIEEMNLSNALKARLSRDTRRKLYEETRKRTKRRKPKDPSKPTASEQEHQQLAKEEEELDKAAAAGPQPAVPSPPGPGNPALRQTQQQAAANSIDTSTEANPQIMKAQQEAADANMQAQQQVAAAEQKTQQQLMEQQQGFQQQLQQADQEKQRVIQENQVLKMQIEKAKVEADVAQAKVKAKEELTQLKQDALSSSGSAENSQLNKLIGSRLQRVQKNVTKAATAGPWNIEVDTVRNPPKPNTIDPVTGHRVGMSELDPTTGKPKLPPLQTLRDNTLQTINDNGMEYMAQGRMPGIHIYNTSYGKIGDLLRQYLLRPVLTTPPAQNQDLSAIGNLSRYGMQFMTQPRF